MWYIWRRVEETMNTMATIRSDHTVAMRRYVVLNHVAYFPKFYARFNFDLKIEIGIN